MKGETAIIRYDKKLLIKEVFMYHIFSYFYSTTKHEIIQIKKSQFTM